jgi:glycosyltransferase involved in cell wall biosynthesis
MARLREINVQMCGKIAGPFEDERIERMVRERLALLENVEYVGPKYGEKKAEFFGGIDILVFPSKFEAEPLTVYEAMSFGIPVIAREKGCIRDMVSSEAGFVISSTDGFVPSAALQIKQWQMSPEVFDQVCENAARRFTEIRAQSIRNIEVIFEDILNDASDVGLRNRKKRKIFS